MLHAFPFQLIKPFIPYTSSVISWLSLPPNSESHVHLDPRWLKLTDGIVRVYSVPLEQV